MKKSLTLFIIFCGLFHPAHANDTFTSPIPSISFDEVSIPLTYQDSTRFQTFLKNHTGHVVSFNTTVMFDVSTDLNQRIYDACNYETFLDTVIESPHHIAHTAINLPIIHTNSHAITCHNQLKIITKPTNTLKLTHGGTGIIHMTLQGNFIIEMKPLDHSITQFSLKEI